MVSSVPGLDPPQRRSGRAANRRPCLREGHRQATGSRIPGHEGAISFFLLFFLLLLLLLVVVVIAVAAVLVAVVAVVVAVLVAVVAVVVAAAMAGRCGRLDATESSAAQLGAGTDTGGGGATSGPTTRRAAPNASPLSKLYEPEGPADLDELTGPVYWPDLTQGEARQEWASLRTWVEPLCERFPHLDHHVIPAAGSSTPVMSKPSRRSATRSESPTPRSLLAPPRSTWHRAFQLTEARLRDWTGQLPCGATHESRTRQSQPIDPTEWEQFVTEDATRRAHHAIASALDGEGRRVAAGPPTP
ncbi:MAG TPA: hypothetical protein VND62_00035 [Acidimicrobiales bacterium]|nr:hypothetical protein [Acidimicrobiales bacterium]